MGTRSLLLLSLGRLPCLPGRPAARRRLACRNGAATGPLRRGLCSAGGRDDWRAKMAAQRRVDIETFGGVGRAGRGYRGRGRGRGYYRVRCCSGSSLALRGRSGCPAGHHWGSGTAAAGQGFFCWGLRRLGGAGLPAHEQPP